MVGLSGESGTLTDSYSYGAFGNPISRVASGPASTPNSSTGAEGISAQSTFLWVAALYAVIATVRRPEVPLRRTTAVYAISAVSGVGGLLLVNADMEGPSLLASFAAWTLLPALAGLLLSRSERETPG